MKIFFYLTFSLVLSDRLYASAVGVRSVYSTTYAFAALKNDGSVAAWGDARYGGDSSAEDLDADVVEVYSNNYAFTALKSDGSVVAWGSSRYGGDNSKVAGNLGGGVKKVFSTDYAFAALKTNGSVVVWGHDSYGGNSSKVSRSLRSGVVNIFSTRRAFAAVKTDGSVVVWGHDTYGGKVGAVSSQLSSGVVTIVSTDQAFAAIKSNGTVVTWGNSDYGGSGSSITGVKEVFSNRYAFAALKKNDSVVTWGDRRYGGNSSSVASSLSNKVKTVFAARYAFAALKLNGSVVTWGYDNYGGDSSGVARRLSSRIVKIFSTDYAFAAVKSNGTVVTWGVADYGGESSVVLRDLIGVEEVFSTRRAFAARKKDGSVVVWGQDSYGGDSSGIRDDLIDSVRDIVSTDYAFAALKDDDSVVTWGRSQYGGDSSAVSDHLEGIIKGVTWTPAVSGKVGIPLILDGAAGMINGDIATYIHVSGSCHFGSGSEVAERTLTFTDDGDCVVKSQVDREGYDAWDSGEKVITVAPGTLTGLGWTPSVTGTVGEDLVLEEVTGTQLGDMIAYARVSGACSLKGRVLSFGDVGSCVVKATVERSGYTRWESGNVTITVAPGTLTGLGWTPAVSGTVGVDLALEEVTGIQLGDVITYARVSGPCSLKKRVLTFSDVGSCVVSATVERSGYTTWESGNVTITVAPGTLKGLGWTPSVTGTVGEDLVLDEVTGTQLGDTVAYARVSGPCSLKKRTLTFGDVGSCVVSATVERGRLHNLGVGKCRHYRGAGNTDGAWVDSLRYRYRGGGFGAG